MPASMRSASSEVNNSTSTGFIAVLRRPPPSCTSQIDWDFALGAAEGEGASAAGFPAAAADVFLFA